MYFIQWIPWIHSSGSRNVSWTVLLSRWEEENSLTESCLPFLGHLTTHCTWIELQWLTSVITTVVLCHIIVCVCVLKKTNYTILHYLCYFTAAMFRKPQKQRYRFCALFLPRSLVFFFYLFLFFPLSHTKKPIALKKFLTQSHNNYQTLLSMWQLPTQKIALSGI